MQIDIKPGDAARAIVIRDNTLLVMKRKKLGQDYTVLVGGKMEAGESPEAAVIREVKEETGVYIAKPRLVFVEDDIEGYGKQLIYMCDYVSGEPVLDLESEEYFDHQGGDNMYFPEWITFHDLLRNLSPFKSERLRTEILQGLTDGFPDVPKYWTP